MVIKQMYGVVALLDEQHHHKVEALWAEFYEKFGVHGVSGASVPHFSFHVAERYNMEKLEATLKRAAREMSPFTVRTNGLGIFTGKAPVLYIPVTRKPELTLFHQRLWEPLSATATSPSPYYHPDQWRPHITLTHQDVDHELLPQVIRLLSERAFVWDMQIDTLALLSSEDEPEDNVMMKVKMGIQPG
ncbi:MAG: 2'-5' RNA ligase family protein [Anaerolineae bacterium]|nr:2'-5' RNA ligase family protein [Anaerolineae bacterium]